MEVIRIKDKDEWVLGSAILDGLKFKFGEQSPIEYNPFDCPYYEDGSVIIFVTGYKLTWVEERYWKNKPGVISLEQFILNNFYKDYTNK